LHLYVCHKIYVFILNLSSSKYVAGLLFIILFGYLNYEH
jgi:hypothetical protein